MDHWPRQASKAELIKMQPKIKRAAAIKARAILASKKCPGITHHPFWLDWLGSIQSLPPLSSISFAICASFFMSGLCSIQPV